MKVLLVCFPNESRDKIAYAIDTFVPPFGLTDVLHENADRFFDLVRKFQKAISLAIDIDDIAHLELLVMFLSAL